MQLCREKGLYFICDEKFYLVNRCPNKHYLLLKMEEDYMDNRTFDPIIENMETFTLQEHPLSDNALKGSSGLVLTRF